MKKQTGFTMIELIAVLVILGILAAVAVPKFVNLGTAARDATVRGIAASLSSAASLNHANNIASDAGLATDPNNPVVPITNCDQVPQLLEGGVLPDKYYVRSRGISNPEGNSRNDCEVAFDSNGNNAFNNADTPKATYTVYRVN